MKQFVKKIQKLNQTKPPLNPDLNEVMEDTLSIAIGIQSLVQQGFKYKDIVVLLHGLEKVDTSFKNIVVDAILAR